MPKDKSPKKKSAPAKATPPIAEKAKPAASSPLEGPVVKPAGRRQQKLDLPDLEVDDVLREAVLTYHEKRDIRQEATKAETSSYVAMLAVMQAKGIDLKQPFSFRRADGRRVKVYPEVVPEELKVRVRLADEED